MLSYSISKAIFHIISRESKTLQQCDTTKTDGIIDKFLRIIYNGYNQRVMMSIQGPKEKNPELQLRVFHLG